MTCKTIEKKNKNFKTECYISSKLLRTAGYIMIKGKILTIFFVNASTIKT